MRIYKTRAEFTALNNTNIFPGTVCTITDEATNPMYVYQGGEWNNTVTAQTDPVTGGNTISICGVDVGTTTRKGLTAALFGDSFSNRNAGATSSRLLDWGYYSWAQALLGSPFTLVTNGGVSGNTTAQMLARIADIAAYAPDWVFVQGGINDLAAAETVANIVANLKSICAQLAGHGAQVVLLTVAPNATYSKGVQQVNQALREWVNGGAKGVILVDTYTAMVNPTSTTGALASGMSDDALHPSGKGARAMGQAIATAIGGLIPSRNFLPSSAAESYAIDSTSKQLLDNPLCAAGGGAPTGTGASGSLPVGWSGSAGGSGAASAVFSTQSRTDGIGLDAQVIVTGAASGSSVNIRQTGLVGRAAIGDTVYLCGQLKISGAADIRTVAVAGNITIDGVTYQINLLEASGTTNVDQSDVTLTIRTPNFTLAGASITSIQYIASVTFGTSGAGAGTIRFGRLGMYKI